MTTTVRLAIDPSSAPALGHVLDFLRTLWAVDHGLERSSKRMEAMTGVTSQQRFVIRIVGRFPGIPAGRLATLLHIHPGTLTGVLKRLEQRGLVRRRTDARDRRRSLVALTEKGRLFDLENEGIVEPVIRHVLGDTPPEQIQAAAGLLEAIAVALGKAASSREDEGLEAKEKSE